jgi:hypothetical protein
VGAIFSVTPDMQSDQKGPVHLIIIVQKAQKYFKQFQSLTMMT